MQSEMSNACLIQQIKKALQSIPNDILQKYQNKLFPIDHSSNIYEGILNKITLTIDAKVIKGMTNPQIIEQIISKSEQFGCGLRDALSNLLKDNFLQKIKQRQCSNNKEKEVNYQLFKKVQSKNKAFQLNGKDGSNKSKILIIQKQTKLNKNVLHHISTNEGLNAINSSCICLKQILPNQQTFKCIHCKLLFHFNCMRRAQIYSQNQCLICHLKYMYPNKQVIRTLLLSILPKGQKMHELIMKVRESEIDKGLKLQIRCFRIKEAAPPFILFPDYTCIQVNENKVRQFLPLHKQSSLKYRKDEPVTIDFKKLTTELKVRISLEIPGKQTKQQRIDDCDHLIGFYLIQEKNILSLCKQLEQNGMNTFEESINILNSLFKLDASRKSEQISLQILQIPLVCPLSTQRIKIPARGIFCKHFQCFDLHNYLMIIANSSNPRWICPLCRKPCYQIVIDCILSAIMDQLGLCFEIPRQVKFYRNGEYELVRWVEQSSRQRKSIHELKIESMLKRKGEEIVSSRVRNAKKKSEKQMVIWLGD